ncbi:Tad domain-containing protein [Lutibaculum baratangense]|uniref:Putative Flp pilus-assembly TadG-like N-terminal domain-containing protein n=1 Tax=Lutibaculum baratangense AMV1 TaxID=631454 RepID=V4RP10_9HYPH|nr:Tad domain-containing protein [Lutibaculum baratangense]ESR26994.1 hypothetical protein N177_0420 [Lutibaculum baratangense AMV1]
MRGFFGKAASLGGNVGGNVAVLTAVSLPVLLGFAGLGAETGYWYFEQRRLQSSADLSAYAGAVIARSGGSGEKIVAAATQEAEYLGLIPGNGTITVNWPPSSGTSINARSVEVLIEQRYRRLFFTSIKDEPVTIVVRAVAAFEQPVSACIIALDETANEALLVSGSADATFTGCTLMSNSLADDALSVRGAVSLSASCLSAAGGVADGAGAVVTECPAPRERMPRAADPYADVPPPPIPSACSASSGGSGPTTLAPGKFCGGLDLKGEVTLEPGVYVVSGGTLRINANSHVVGDGVTFYLTNGASVQMNGTAHVEFRAPASGTYEGMLFYADPHSSGSSALFNGTADSSLIGSLYFPTQPVDMRGDFGGSGGCTRIVARTVEIGGNATFTSDCTGAAFSKVAAPGAVHLVE